jgi:hypothetical protein
MRSDSIHDSVWCAERRGRTRARSIDAAIVTDPTYGCDCRLANGIYRHSWSKRSQKRRCSGFRGISRRRPALMSSSTSRSTRSSFPSAMSRFICSSHSSSFQPWNHAASLTRSSKESCSIGVLISAMLGANNRRRPRPSRDLRISPYNPTSFVPD